MIENDLPVFLSSILASPNEDIRIEAAWYVEHRRMLHVFFNRIELSSHAGVSPI